ncbi:hypothetical protein E4U12_003901 [Claviceps purpurea]|nr:hypothetical protein E4U12_003901 [Claviceps purpurea]
MAPTTRITAKSTEGPESCSAPGVGVPPPQDGACAPKTSPIAPTLTLQQVEAMELQTRATQAETARIQAAAERLQAETGRQLAQAPALPPADADSLGEHFPLNVRMISRELAGVAVEDIDDIRTGKFEPWNLIRLHPVRGQRPSEDEGTSNVDISSGQFTVKKKNHSPSEYASDPLIFLNSFANDIYVYHRPFGREHPDVVIAQIRFLSFIIEKAQTYVWTKCLDYAMKRFTSVKASTIHDAEEWLEHPKVWTDSFFTTNHSLPLPSSSQKRQRSNTAVTPSTTSPNDATTGSAPSGTAPDVTSVPLLRRKLPGADVDVGCSLVLRGALASDRVEADKVPGFELPGADVVDILDGHASKFSRDHTDIEGEVLTE